MNPNIEQLVAILSSVIVIICFFIALLFSVHVIPHSSVEASCTHGYQMSRGGNCEKATGIDALVKCPRGHLRESPGGCNRATSGGTDINASSAAASPGADVLTITILKDSWLRGNPDYEPDNAQVPQNTKIVWINADSVVHTATSGTGLRDPNSGLVFDTGIIKSGGTSVPLELVGATEGDQIPYYCRIHPYMTSIITLTA